MSEAFEGLLRRGLAARREHRLQDARRLLRDAVATGREEACGTDLARALTAVGQTERDLQRGDIALAYYEEAAAIYRAKSDSLKVAHTVRHIADIQFELGRADLAEPHYHEALAIYRSHEEISQLELANAVRGLALLKGGLGETQVAKELWAEARDLYAAVNVKEGVAESSRRLALLAQNPRQSV
jgi:tetratricopeptide (TPR) repeat protein